LPANPARRTDEGARGWGRLVRCLAILAWAGGALALGGCAFVLPQTEAIRGHWPAALADHVELDGVPFFAQQAYQCGPASLAMAMQDAGVPVTPDALVPRVYLPERHGSLQIEMVAAPRAWGLVSWPLAPRLEDVLREVAAGSPVVVLQDYGVWPFHVWHYAVVVGYDRERRRVVLRSGEKERLEMPFAVLEYTWKPGDYWAMVALPPSRIAATADEAAWTGAVTAMARVAPAASGIEAYRTLLARWPDSLMGAIGLANLHYQHGALEPAEAVLRRAVERHPDSTVALNNLAQVLAERQQLAEALRLAERAVALGGPFRRAAEETRAGIRAKMAASPAAL
jgi:hypothetical protein